MSDYNDDDDSSKVEELDMDGTSKATQKKKVLSDGYNRPPIIVSYRGEDIDVTQKYKNATDKVYVPSSEKKAFYWNFYHCGVQNCPGGKEEKQTSVAMCNLCGKVLTIKSRNYSTLEKHLLSVVHSGLYRAALEQHTDKLSKSQKALIQDAS